MHVYMCGVCVCVDGVLCAGPNQKEYRRDTRRDDRVVMEFEELYYVVRKVHRASFQPLQAPLPKCTACFLEKGVYVPAKYFSKQVVSRVHSLGVCGCAVGAWLSLVVQLSHGCRDGQILHLHRTIYRWLCGAAVCASRCFGRGRAV